MDSKTLEGLLDIFAVLREAELSVKAFYDACAAKWPEGAEFWSGIAEQEARHAQDMERMAAMLRARPDDFQPGQLLNPVAIRTFIKGMAWNLDRVSRGELDQVKALHVARDVESALIEHRIAEMVRTSDQAFLSLARQVAEDTLRHRRDMDARLAALKK